MKVIKGVQVGPRRVMVYGRHGMGKTSWAASAPNPLILDMEGGSNDIDVDRTPIYTTLDALRDDIRGIVTSDKFEYDSLVVDSVDWLEKLVQQKVWEDYEPEKGPKPKNFEGIGYGRGYVMAAAMVRGVLKAFDLIQKKHGCHIILVSHAAISKYEDPTTEAYDRITPAMHVNSKGEGFAMEVLEWCDEVFYLAEKVFTRESERGFNQKVVKAIGSGELVLHTRSQPAFDAKSRLTLPAELPFPKGGGWAEYAKYFPKQETKQQVKEN